MLSSIIVVLPGPAQTVSNSKTQLMIYAKLMLDSINNLVKTSGYDLIMIELNV